MTNDLDLIFTERGLQEALAERERRKFGALVDDISELRRSSWCGPGSSISSVPSRSSAT
jgi:hypothetical protein